MSANPICMKGLDHVVLRVRDLSTSIAFYEGVLGCTIERRVDELGLVQLRAGTSLIDLVGIDTPLGKAGGGERAASGPNLDHFALALEKFDAESILAHLSRHSIDGGTPASRFGAEGFGPSIYIQDPDGNTIELKGPPDPDSEGKARQSE
jgi:glyoxylase I family protein